MTFDTSNYELERPLPGKNIKVICLGVELGIRSGKMTQFIELRGKSFYYLMYDGSEDKKSKHQIMCHKKLRTI